MEILIKLESKTEKDNNIQLDSDDANEIYIIIDNNEYRNVICLQYEQVKLFARAINIWLDTGYKE